MRTEFVLYPTEAATYTHVVVDGHVHPLNADACVVPGDRLDVTVEHERPYPEVHWVTDKYSMKNYASVPPEALIDIAARKLVSRE